MSRERRRRMEEAAVRSKAREAKKRRKHGEAVATDETGTPSAG
jgi:hypothetical protein